MEVCTFTGVFIVSKLSQLSKTMSDDVQFEKSKPLRSTVCKLVQPANIRCALVILNPPISLKSTDSKELIDSNI